MSPYFVLQQKGIKSKFDASYQGILLNSKNDIIYNPFNRGEKIPPSDCFKLKVLDSKLGVMRDRLSVTIQNDETIFVISERALGIFSDYTCSLSIHKLQILRNGEITDNSFAVNITSMIDCIDHYSSSLIYYEEEQETVYNINELSLDETKIPPDVNIFLLGETRGTVIIVHERFIDRIEAAKLTGFNFCQPISFVL